MNLLPFLAFPDVVLSTVSILGLDLGSGRLKVRPPLFDSAVLPPLPSRPPYRPPFEEGCVYSFHGFAAFVVRVVVVVRRVI